MFAIVENQSLCPNLVVPLQSFTWLFAGSFRNGVPSSAEVTASVAISHGRVFNFTPIICAVDSIRGFPVFFSSPSEMDIPSDLFATFKRRWSTVGWHVHCLSYFIIIETHDDRVRAELGRTRNVHPYRL